MEPTTARKIQLDDAYETLIQVCLYDRPLVDMESYLADDVMNFGAGKKEITKTKAAFLEQIKNQKKLAEGLKMDFQLKPVLRKIINQGNGAIYTDDIVNTVWIDGAKTELISRLSFIFEYRENKWILVHSHTSTPGPQRSEDEVLWPMEELKKRTAVLEKSLEEKIAELEFKNRELEIESALESVRTVAMGMQHPVDMLDVCRIISAQLHALRIGHIRNIQTAIFYETKGVYLNYEYFSLYDSTCVTEVEYNLQPDVKAFVDQMLKDPDAFFTTSFEGSKLKDWIAYQQEANQFVDPKLNEVDTLHYYFYSIGPGALGISTYAPLKDNDIAVFKRFRNVFELAYRRFIDIENAIAQAKEALIETSLERVRAQAMSMRIPVDLLGVCEALFAELHKLGFNELRNAMINIHDDAKESFLNYDYSDTAGKTITHHFYNSHPIIENQVKQVRSSADAFSETIFSGKELEEWKAFRREKGEPDDPKAENVTALFYYFYSIGTGAIGISTYSSITGEKRNTLKRFRNVFDLAYRRFMDIQQAEAQAREALIEAGLERVRSRAMAMHKSDELLEVGALLYNELTKLGIEKLTAGYMLIDEDEKMGWNYGVNPASGQIVSKPIGVPLTETKVLKSIVASWKKKEPLLVQELDPGETLRHQTFMAEQCVNFPISKEQLLAITPERLVIHTFNFKHGYLLIVGGILLTAAQQELVVRFAKVFEMTYRRFLDLKQAEAQAMEAQIETALEKVRSRSLAMHKSDELQEVVHTVFEKLKELNVELYTAIIFIFTEGSRDVVWWLKNKASQQYSRILVPYADFHYLEDLFEAREDGKDFFSKTYSFEEKNDLFHHLFENTDFKNVPEKQKEFLLGNELATMSVGLAKNTGINITSYTKKSFSDRDNEILKRFAKVFEQAYTRFLDLQKAEAQTRESQIELGLERVRAKAMAMQRSDELKELIGTVFTELTKLDIVLTRCLIMIYDPGTNDSTWWMANSEAPSDPIGLVVQYHEHPPYLAYIKAWQERNLKWQYILEGTVKKNWDDFLFVETGLSHLPGFVIDGMKAPDRVYLNASFNSFGNLTLATLESLSEEHFDIMLRFAKVFDLTYTRFNDLQKAEANAKEAKIEASLERVRSRAMAMHISQDLADTIGVFYRELHSFSITPIRCGVGILDREERVGELFTWNTTEQGKGFELVGRLKMEGHPVLNKVYESWLTQTEYHPVLRGHQIKEYYTVLRPQIAFPEYTNDDVQYGYFFFFKEGGVYAWTEKEMKEDELQIYRRFTSVLSLTYKRYRDLQQAEAQAKEAQIEAALERVRSRTLAMQKSDELAETAAVLFKQLILLGIEPNRLYITIIRDETGNAEFWITDEDGTKVSSSFETNMHSNAAFEKMFEGWQTKKKSLIIDMQGKELQEYFEHLGSLHVPFKDGLSQKRRIQHIAYFGKGFIGMASPDEQPEETMILLERFAGVFNLTFTRFNDLKIAEAHALQAEQDLLALMDAKKKAEDALTELKATQSQLIQSEKMASLGELTAGIAHEIQNPLNFVNNFSEVNAELLEELKSERTKVKSERNEKLEEELLTDIADNEQKINHHGKRADAIVKGMLQHSRSSSGIKEPTDLNALADEYLRLAYHGLRAKNNSFNAAMKTDFDQSIGNIDIIPQDIGRVLLNLINNAFYAIADKRKQQPDHYEPIVSVTTKKMDDKILIAVTDNGNGIPQKVLDKIFQPFFTTKPTGQGTGLGLSLSYDIIKAHGGEVKVQSNVGEGSDFIIQLPVS